MSPFLDSKRYRQTRHFGVSLLILAGMIWLAGCKGSDPTGGGGGSGGGGSGGSGGSGSAKILRGGGATFDDPIMQKWSAEYKQSKGVAIDYVKSGSGDGIKQMTAKNLDFGCSDAPMNKKEMSAADKEGGTVLNVPIIMGAVAIVYNVPGIEGQLVLSGPVLADIYTKKGKHWDDKDIAELNPGTKLPHLPIVPVYRAEASGTSFIFTDFMSKTSPEFAKAIGASKSPKWPQLGTGQQGSDGIAGFVKDREGAIGYVEFYFAQDLRYAKIRNQKGHDIAPTAEGPVAAAEAAMQAKPTEEPYSLHEHAYPMTNAPAETAYPICAMSFLVCYKKQPAGSGQALKDFLHWATTDGQKFADELRYAPLPKKLSEQLQPFIDTIELTP